MKHIIIYITGLFLLFALNACEENEDGYYDNIYRVYFPQDSINFSFGDKPDAIVRDTIYYPVKVLGLKVKQEMKFKISVNAKETTAEANKHYVALQKEYPVLVDSVDAYIPIELIRSTLSEEEVSYKIVLNLETNGDFTTGIQESLRAVLTFNNYLEEPWWWSNMLGNYAPNYKPGMYRRMIAYYGKALDDEYINGNHYLEFMAVFKTQVYDYAQEHPELGWEFADGLWWPFD